MTFEDFLTLSLRERIVWLRSGGGPRGKISHDTLAAELETTRQTVIGWERGAQPSERYAEKLSEFSGFPAYAFRRREAEDAHLASSAHRLQAIEERLGLLATTEHVEHGFEALQAIEERLDRLATVEHFERGLKGLLDAIERQPRTCP